MAAIFEHHLAEMTDAVVEALSERGTRPVAEVVREALAAYWRDTGAITWTVNDVLGEYPALTKDQARAVLIEMVHGHDASIGINWDNMGDFVGLVVPDYDLEKEDEAIRDAVNAYAERLVAAGDMAAFESVFGSDDPNFDVGTIDSEDLRDIYRDYVVEEEEEHP